MMFCKNCGAPVADDATTCAACCAPIEKAQTTAGAPTAADVVSTPSQQPSESAPAPSAAPATEAAATASAVVPPSYTAPSQTVRLKEPVSILAWLGRMLLPYIPFVGWIANLIMLFVWSGDQNKEETSRNWAKARLIVAAVNVLLMILVIVAFVVLAASRSFHGSYIYR